MEHTPLNPFVPPASIIRYPNAVYEVRIHLPGSASNVEIVPHDNYILVTGRFVPRLRRTHDGRHVGVLVWTDQPCGFFGRDIPFNLTRGTEILVLESRQDCDDFIVRYTIRNSYIARGGCAPQPQGGVFANTNSGINVNTQHPSGHGGCQGANNYNYNAGGQYLHVSNGLSNGDPNRVHHSPFHLGGQTDVNGQQGGCTCGH